jgi:hypothetical protein
VPTTPAATTTSPPGTGYLVIRAVVDVLARRTFEPVTREQLQVGPLHIDVAAHTVDVDDGTSVPLTRGSDHKSAQDNAKR